MSECQVSCFQKSSHPYSCVKFSYLGKYPAFFIPTLFLCNTLRKSHTITRYSINDPNFLLSWDFWQRTGTKLVLHRPEHDGRLSNPCKLLWIWKKACKIWWAWSCAQYIQRQNYHLLHWHKSKFYFSLTTANLKIKSSSCTKLEEEGLILLLLAKQRKIHTVCLK